MTDDSTEETDPDQQSLDSSQVVETTTVSSTYKVIGEFDDSGGAGVVGKNTASSGTPIGVEGAVPNATGGYGLSTPDDARIGGALDSVGAHTVTVDGSRALDLGAESGADAGNVVAGHSSNATEPGVVGATVGGGGSDDGSSPEPNVVYDDYGTVSGGKSNTAGSDDGDPTTDRYSTVGGGTANAATGYAATVGGGDSNDAGADFATIGGGGWTNASYRDSSSNGVYDEYGTVGGGGNNQAGSNDGDATTARFATVGGGEANEATAKSTSILGGYANEATQDFATVGGGNANDATGEAATVSGGTSNTATGSTATVGGGYQNDATDSRATVAGGRRNGAHDPYATVGGGDGNVVGAADGSVSAYGGTISGGQNNAATATYATVPGGYDNEAGGISSFAAGSRAKADHGGTFVWADDTGSDLASTGAGQFLVRSTGGVWFGDTNSPDLSSGFVNTSTGAYLSNGGTWTNASSAAYKTDFAPVDPAAVLQSVNELGISTWAYEDEDDGARHIGPTAEAFHEAFGFGRDDASIATVDADGVALAAIQGLADRLDRTNERLRERLDDRNDRVEEVTAENELLRERAEALESRLAAVEAHVGVDGTTDRRSVSSD